MAHGPPGVCAPGQKGRAVVTPSDEIKRSLIHKILIGHYPLGSTLPSCRDLAAELGINRNTASKIYQELAREGLVKAVRGRGVVVIRQRSAGGAPAPSVREHILAAAREAKLLGMERDAFLQAAVEVANSLYQRQRPAVAFVECNEQDGRSLAREIEAELSFPVQPILLSALERAPGVVAADYDIVCTTLYHILAVKKALALYDDKVIAVHAPPDPDALLEIAHLDPATRIENRIGEPSANPYLYIAAQIVSGLDGIANRRDPGKRLDINMYTEGQNLKNVRRLPLNLLDAIRLTDKSAVLREQLGQSFIDSYVKMKTEEWQSYMRHLSSWEIANKGVADEKIIRAAGPEEAAEAVLGL